MSEKPVPRIAGEDDLRLSESVDEAGSVELASSMPVGKPANAPQWEPKSLREHLSLARLSFAQKLIGWCVFAVIALTLCQQWWPREASLIPGAIDTLKLIVTTALGYLFGRTSERD